MLRPLRFLLLFALTSAGLVAALHATDPKPTHRSGGASVSDLRITILSTNLAERGIGEWGFAALVEADGYRLLFDTGNYPDTVERNLVSLKLDLSEVTDVVLSHHHQDHVGGLAALRRRYSKSAPSALSKTHVAEGAFLSRGPGRYAGDENPLIALRPEYEALGGTFLVHSAPIELRPGIWFTGPIPRVHPQEQPIPHLWKVRTADGSTLPDSTPEDAALVIHTQKGLVVLTGCGHAGLINTLKFAREVSGQQTASIYAVIGGFHLFRSPEASLDWTATQLKALGVSQVHGAHCTGLEALYRLRVQLGLEKEAAAVLAVGSWFAVQGKEQSRSVLP